MENYSKTILSCYTTISGYITQIEDLIRAKARNSFYSRCDVVNLSEQLLSLGEIRKDLFELISITDEVLSSLKAQDRILISYKYFGEMPDDENFDHTSRNYFRRQISAVKRFTKALLDAGYDKEWFDKKYMKIAFIYSMYQKTLLEQGKKHVR